MELELPSKDELELRRASIDLLARREHSCEELRRKLSRRFGERFSSNLIDCTLELLAKEGLQSDLRFAESYTRSRVDRGDGPFKIRSTLKERGVHQGLIEQVLDGDNWDWFALAADLFDRKFGHLHQADNQRLELDDGDSETLSADQRAAEYASTQKQRAREARFLQSRGFPRHIISELIHQ